MYRTLPNLALGTRSAFAKRLGSSRSLRAIPCHAISKSMAAPPNHRGLFHTHSILGLESSSKTRAEVVARSTSTVSASAASTSASSYSDGGPATPGVTTDAKSRSVYVTWASGITSKFHNIWLRDHCRCSQCYHPTTKQRLLNTFEIPADAQPLSAEATTEGLLVHWPLLPSERPASASSSSASEATSEASHSNAAGSAAEAAQQHASLYPWRWLMRNSYSPVLSDPITASNDGTGLQGIEKVLWGKGVGSAPPTVKFDEVMQSDEGLLKWLTKIAQYGFAFVSGVPTTPTDTEALIRRIAFIRETHYGGFWDFTSDLSHGDTAYTDLALQAHTDTTYFTDPAGLQMFHLLSHTASKPASGSAGNSTSSTSSSSSSSSTSVSIHGPSGGESLLVDGFLAAAVLKDVHPDAYETLSRIRIRTHSAGDENTLIRPLFDGGYPILQHDEVTGQLVLIRYNNDDRSVLRIDAEDVESFYDALRKWNEILTNAEGEYWVQLKPGTALIFDNHRVLHGRSAFVGNRRLCGAYVNHDDYRSRLSVLRSQLADNSPTPTRRGVWDDGL